MKHYLHNVSHFFSFTMLRNRLAQADRLCSNRNVGWSIKMRMNSRLQQMAVVVLATVLGGLALAADTAQGYVYHDANANGRFDKGELGLAGMPVSNGSDIVLTDETGKWSLESGPSTTLFVLARDGWMPPMNEWNLPQFHYVHRENGSQETRYAGAPSTGPLPESINFALQPFASDDAFSVVLFGDPQPNISEQIDFFVREVVGEVAELNGMSFGLSLGDIVGNDLSLYAAMNEAISLIGLPWYHVIGNHDINFDVERDEDSSETFQSVYGPTSFAFQRGKAHFLLLDDVVYWGKTFAGKVKSGEIKDQRDYVGGFTEEQFTFIENYLKLVPKDELVVLCMHIPLFQRRTSYYERIESFRKGDRERLFALLKDHPKTLSFSAHTHFQKQVFFGLADGWLGKEEHLHVNLGTTCGDWFKGFPSYDGYPDATMRDGTPNGYAVLSIRGGEYELRYQVFGAPAEKQMSLYVPFSWQQQGTDDRALFANFYMGTDRTRALCRFGDSQNWIPMEQSYEPDPRSLALFEFQKAMWEALPKDANPLYRPMSLPQPCSHLWKVRLPEGLDSGFHRAEVKMVDHHGREFSDSIAFRIR